MALAFPNSVVNILDTTVQSGSQPLGITAFVGVTQRGTIGGTKLVKSWQEYRENYGEILDHSVSLFPIYVKRALDLGGQLYISRVEHLTDINDPTTTTAAVAAAPNGGVFPLAVNIFGTDVALFQLKLQGDYTAFILPAQAHVVQHFLGGTTNLVVASATFASGITTITYTALTFSFAGDTLTWNTTLVTSINMLAKNVGTWGNSITFEIKNAASSIPNKLDIFVYLAGSSDLNETYRNFSSSPTVIEITAFNERMKLVDIDVITTPIGVCPKIPLIGGTDTLGSITNLDYIGGAGGSTGLRAFDAETGIVKICVPDMQDNQIDIAILDYCILRGDSLAILQCPPTAETYTALDYRNQTGIYTGTKIDNWRAGRMLFGGIKVVSPYDNASIINIGWIGDFIGLSSVKDNKLGPWISVAGQDNPLTNVKDIIYNIFTFARAQEQTDIAAAGLTPIIKKDSSSTTNSKRIFIWGNNTMQVADSLLSFANNAELCIYIHNRIKPIEDGELFHPNDPLTWKSIYRQVDVVMSDIQTRRGVSAYRYVGDQNADTVNDAVINTPATIAIGKYIFFLYFSPIGALNEIEGNAVVTGEGSLIEQFA